MSCGPINLLGYFHFPRAYVFFVLPLDDRFAPRFADNAKRFHGPRNRFVFHAGMGHVPTDVAPDASED